VSCRSRLVGAVAFLADCTELNTIEDQFSLIAFDLGTMEKVFLLRLILRGEGGRFKKSDISYTALIMGLEAPVLLGFRYYKGR